MLRGIKRELLLAAAIGTLGAGTHWVNSDLEQRRQSAERAVEVAVLPNGEALRVLSLGFDRLVADLFWVRTIYYVGDERTAAMGYPNLDGWAELVTDIDPGFRTVYVVMSGAIGVLQGDPDKAIALLEKSVRHVDYWKLHFLLGFYYFSEKADFGNAAKHIEIASGKPGSPPYLATFAAKLYDKAGESETALEFIRARLAVEEQPEMRAALQKRYWDLWISRDLRQIDEALGLFRTRHGRDAEALRVLVAEGLLERVPKDPRGGDYRIDRGRAATDLPYERMDVHLPGRSNASDIERSYKRLEETDQGKGKR